VVSLLEEKNISYVTIEYLKTPLSVEEILNLSKKLNKKPIDFVRKNDQSFKENSLGFNVLNDIKMAELIIKCPKILERPIVVKGKKAIIGRPPENILKLFE
tara:strand:+ start:87 stop:389 length:303 start_codon:yes stop_codon:yes gene_type:complete